MDRCPVGRVVKSRRDRSFLSRIVKEQKAAKRRELAAGGGGDDAQEMAGRSVPIRADDETSGEVRTASGRSDRFAHRHTGQRHREESRCSRPARVDDRCVQHEDFQEQERMSAAPERQLRGPRSDMDDDDVHAEDVMHNGGVYSRQEE